MGTVTPSALNVETTVVDIPAQGDEYIVEGWIDLGALQSGDSVVVREYVAVDGTNYRLFAEATFDGPVDMPAVRFHAKTLTYNMRYRVTVTQTAGSALRSFPYAFVVEVLGTV
jgi:hypothetical protein